jgi:hypothetical protein
MDGLRILRSMLIDLDEREKAMLRLMLNDGGQHNAFERVLAVMRQRSGGVSSAGELSKQMKRC